MGKNPSIACSSTFTDDFESDESRLDCKLRRLKIQEEILTKSYNKCALKCDPKENAFKEGIELGNYLQNIKNAYSEIKTLFQDVKTITKEQENFKNSDIDDVKKDILELEKKISVLKEFFRNEIYALKAAEKELLIEIDEKSKEKVTNSRIAIKPYSDVIPSPVRALINSPFKCKEVQRFQDFLKSNKRFDGWDEYNHNMFVNIWNKHYGDNVIEKRDRNDASYLKFKDEICMKIFGVNSDDVHSHTRWYNEYLSLKKCQEAALNKWRENKRKIKCPPKPERESFKIKYDNTISKEKSKSAKLSEVNDDTWELDASNMYDENSLQSVGVRINKHQCLQSHLYNSTKQWTRRCQKNETNESQNMNIDRIQKLKIPIWRLDTKYIKH